MKIRENNRICSIVYVGLFSIMHHNVSNKTSCSVWVKEYRRRFGHLLIAINIGITRKLPR